MNDINRKPGEQELLTLSHEGRPDLAIAKFLALCRLLEGDEPGYPLKHKRQDALETLQGESENPTNLNVQGAVSKVLKGDDDTDTKIKEYSYEYSVDVLWVVARPYLPDVIFTLSEKLQRIVTLSAFLACVEWIIFKASRATSVTQLNARTDMMLQACVEHKLSTNKTFRAVVSRIACAICGARVQAEDRDLETHAPRSHNQKKSRHKLKHFQALLGLAQFAKFRGYNAACKLVRDVTEEQLEFTFYRKLTQVRLL
eukprot:g13542.t1